MRYSPSRNGFYPENVNYPDIPPDIIFITDELYHRLLQGQSEGKIITANGNELPYLTEPTLTKGQHIAAAEVKKNMLINKASMAIAPLQDAIELGINTDVEAKALKELKIYRVLLNRIDTSSAPEINWPTQPEV